MRKRNTIPLEEIGIAFYKQNIQADILKKMLCLVYTTNQLPEEKDHFLKTLLLREVPEGQPYYLVRTEHGNYELCIQENGIKITLPESQDFLAGTFLGSVWRAYCTSGRGRPDCLYRRYRNLRAAGKYVPSASHGFRHYGKNIAKFLKRKSFGRKEEPLSRQKARKKPEIIITQKGGCSLPVGIKAGIRKISGRSVS